MKTLDALINEGTNPMKFGLHLMGAFDTAPPEQWMENLEPTNDRLVIRQDGSVAVDHGRRTPNLWRPGREKRLARMKRNRRRNAEARAAAN